jgi:TolA-binding protein
MKHIRIFGLALVLVMAACGGNKKEDAENKTPEKPDREEWLKRISDVEKKMYEKPNEPINPSLANVAIDFYNKFAVNFPQDSLAPEYLFKAGEISSALNYSAPAINFFKTIYEKYPAYKKASTCLFLQGFIYETQLSDTAKARAIYIEVIKKYPGTQFASDSKASIDNLGKTPDQLIKEFEAKNKKK